MSRRKKSPDARTCIGRDGRSRNSRAAPCFLVDDGIATGSTFLASALAIRSLQPRRLVGVIPVGPPRRSVRFVRSHVDELVILMTPDPFYAVGNFFADFTQVEDRDVIQYLNLAEEAMLERTPVASLVRRLVTLGGYALTCPHIPGFRQGWESRRDQTYQEYQHDTYKLKGKLAEPTVCTAVRSPVS